MARLLTALVAGLVALAVVAVATIERDPRPIDEARRIADHDATFASADNAGRAMLRISALLREQAERCVRDEERGAGARRCQALFAASGHAQAASVGLLRCSRPDLFDAQRAMRSHLEALADDPESAVLPRLAYCT